MFQRTVPEADSEPAFFNIPIFKMNLHAISAFQMDSNLGKCLILKVELSILPACIKSGIHTLCISLTGCTVIHQLLIGVKQSKRIVFRCNIILLQVCLTYGYFPRSYSNFDILLIFKSPDVERSAQHFCSQIFTVNDKRFVGIRNHIKKCLRSEEHTSELQSRAQIVCRLLLEKR